jgi:hypothetical protein
MLIKELSSTIEKNFDQFMQLMAEFSEEQLNTVPYSGGWTAGQVANHIILATDGLPDTQTASPDRQIDLYVNPIESIFLDFSTNMPAFDFLTPKARIYQKDELIGELNRIKQKLIDIANTKDLSLLCLDFELPQMGHLTRYEWLKLIVAHTLRHTHQLKRVKQHVNMA